MENFHHKFANLVPPPTDGTKKCLLRCKAHPDSNSRRKWRPNPCIIADSIISQTGKKLTKNAVRKFAACCGAIWRRREKLQYRLVHSYNSSRA